MSLLRVFNQESSLSSPQIAYVDGPRLRRSLIAACQYAEHQRAELNRINVFPVPDGDTGTNLALTVRAIGDHLRGVSFVLSPVSRARRRKERCLVRVVMSG